MQDGQSWGKVKASGRTSPIGRGDLGRNSNLINPPSHSISLFLSLSVSLSLSLSVFPLHLFSCWYYRSFSSICTLLLALSSCSRLTQRAHTKCLISVLGNRGVPCLVFFALLLCIRRVFVLTGLHVLRFNPYKKTRII